MATNTKPVSALLSEAAEHISAIEAGMSTDTALKYALMALATQSELIGVLLKAVEGIGDIATMDAAPSKRLAWILDECKKVQQ